MKKARIEKEIFIKEHVKDKDTTTTGYLTIKSSETIRLDEIRGVIFSKCRGKIAPAKHYVWSFEVDSKKELIQDKSYIIPFTINLSRLKKHSYKGVYAHIYYYLEIQIDVNEDDIKKIDENAFSITKLYPVSTLYPTTKLHVKTILIHQYFSIKKPSEDFNYQVVEETNNFTIITTNIGCYVLILFPFVFMFAVQLVATVQMPHGFSFLFLVVISYFLLSYQVFKYIASIVEQISMTPLKDKDGFICKISTKGKIKLKESSLYYTVTETVVDDRGTTRTTHTESLFTSNTYQLDNSKANQEFKFPYPAKKGLEPFNLEAVSVVWNVIIKGECLGFPIECKCPIKVELVNKLNEH